MSVPLPIFTNKKHDTTKSYKLKQMLNWLYTIFCVSHSTDLKWKKLK